ncbi:hypothetical protein niasHT_037356 [Heterodera trifolii]|uniref:Uncharacterized protein n=1 Tax=Heterodera trifolii TaxID=157864 RepID=A0ABD2J526_9BILA
MNDYWVSLCNFRAKQMKELEAENEFLRNRCALQEEIIIEIKKCSLLEEEEGAKVEEAPSVPAEDNNHSSSTSTSSTSTTLCSPNTESSPSMYGTCTVVPLQSTTSFASFDSPPPGLSNSQNSHNGGANSSSSSSHPFRYRELRARLMRLLCCCCSNNAQLHQPINHEGQDELN